MVRGEEMIRIEKEVLEQIRSHGEAAYPEEGAGLLLGSFQAGNKVITAILPLENSREESARHNRYLLSPADYLRGEEEAERLGLEVLGIFHSHPDHPDQPSDFDREWAMPWFSYIITRVDQGRATSSRSWLLAEDRSSFLEEPFQVRTLQNQIPEGE
jgi:proteasome lid subunit RPN8/RPN11